MKHTILIPVDGTESAEETSLYVQSITPREDTHIVLMHVTPIVDTANASLDTIPSINIIKRTLQQDGWSVQCETRMGDPVEEMIKMTMLLPATMVLMSTHGRSGFERIQQGSVTEQVLRQSPCPVFILHSTRDEPADNRKQNLFKRILVPLDGSDASSAILKCVEQFAKLHDSEVVMFHDELDHVESEDEKAAIKAKLQDQSVALANTGIKVTLDMSTYRRPSKEILDRINELHIDLVSMATHGDDGRKRAVEASVTADIVRHSNCPLLVWSAEPQCRAM